MSCGIALMSLQAEEYYKVNHEASCELLVLAGNHPWPKLSTPSTGFNWLLDNGASDATSMYSHRIARFRETGENN